MRLHKCGLLSKLVESPKPKWGGLLLVRWSLGEVVLYFKGIDKKRWKIFNERPGTKCMWPFHKIITQQNWPGTWANQWINFNCFLWGCFLCFYKWCTIKYTGYSSFIRIRNWSIWSGNDICTSINHKYSRGGLGGNRGYSDTLGIYGCVALMGGFVKKFAPMMVAF